MRIIDVTDDLGASLKAFIDEVGADNLSDTVKTASWLEPASGRDRDYALILVDDDGTAHRKFACHDPGNTLVSMFYLEKVAQPSLNPAAIKVAATNLGSLARDWGLQVPAEIEKMASTALSERAARDIVDARRVHYRPPKVASAPRAPGPFEKVADVERRWDDLTPHERRASALEIVKLASELPVSVPDRCYRYAGDKLSEKFAMRMAVRKDHTSDPAVRTGYDQLAKTASLFPLDNVVDALYLLDEAAHLRWAGGDKYGENLPDPVRCVFETTKVAAFFWTHGAEHVSEHDLAAYLTRENARTHFTDTFTDELWGRFVKDPISTFKAMPTEQKILLSRLARAE